MWVSRRLFSKKTFTGNLTIVVLLSFGLGTAALLYTALDRLLLHPLPVGHPETLVRILQSRPPLAPWASFTYNDYKTIETMHSLADVAAEGTFDTVATTNSGTEHVVADMVSSTYFSMLDVAPQFGRTFSQMDEQSGGEIPVVLSYRLWVRDFAASRAAIGSTLRLEGHPFVIVGVMPQRFFGTKLDESPDLWLPFVAQSVLSNQALTDAKAERYFSVLGRLRSGVTASMAQAEFSGIYEEIKKANGFSDTNRHGIVVPITEGSFALRAQFSQALMLLMWGLAALLLMICASIAGLLLAKAARRERDTAVRVALGASRSRLVFHAVTESVCLGLIGGIGGLGVAYFCSPLLTSLLPAGNTPLPVSLIPSAKIDFTILGLALSISLLFGAIPAWLSSHVEPQLALRRGTATKRVGILSRVLLAFETGMTFVLLVGAGLLLHTFYILRHTSPGFDVEHLICFSLNLDMGGPSVKLPPTFPEILRERMQSLPGVKGVTLSDAALMQRIGLKASVALSGQKIPSDAFLNTSLNYVSSTFFETLNIPVLSGRSFSDVDALHSSPTPTVVNEAFAQAIFPNQNPVGKTFGMGSPGNMAQATHIVIGVVGDSKYRSLREPLLPIFYAPFEKNNWDSYLFIYVRTDSTPSSIINAARKLLLDIEPQVPFANVVTMHEQVSESLWQERLLTTLTLIFSVVSVLMAGTGLYGLLAYDTNQRIREFGIRVAVGAQKKDTGMLVLQELLKVIVPGIILGSGIYLLSMRIMQSILYGVKPFDPISFVGALLTIGIIGLAAIWQPLHRAMSVDPAIVLREE